MSHAARNQQSQQPQSPSPPNAPSGPQAAQQGPENRQDVLALIALCDAALKAGKLTGRTAGIVGSIIGQAYTKRLSGPGPKLDGGKSQVQVLEEALDPALGVKSLDLDVAAAFKAVDNALAREWKGIRFRFRTDNGGESQAVHLTLTGPTSQEPGALSVTDGDSRANGGAYYGRISRNGVWIMPRSGAKAVPEAVQGVVLAFLADPMATIASMGRRTGVDSLTGRPLTGSGAKSGISARVLASFFPDHGKK